MKKFKYRSVHSILLVLLAVTLIMMSSCQKETLGSPVITGVRNYVASPNDTILLGAVAKAQWVVIEGENLQNATQISFDGVPTTFNSALFTLNSVVVQIPAILFSTIDVNKLYTIEYVTTKGSTTFSFKLGPAAPVITAISDVFANPGDSIYIYGTDFFLVQSLSYGGATITSGSIRYDGTAIGFKMPSPAPSSGEVSITTMSGTATYKIVALPTITGISNENASVGDSVYVYGTYLKGIQSFTFSGATISSFVLATDGSSVGFKMPSITTSGPASIKTPFGTATTAYNVYNIYNVQYVGVATIGVLANLEWGDSFGWQWWGGIKNATGIKDFNGVLGSNNSQFAYMKTGIMNSGEGTSYDNKYNFPIDGAKMLDKTYKPGFGWLSVANLSDPVDNWAIQFEMSVAQPWNGGTLCFETGIAGSYMARYEPWQISASSTKAFSTKGWQTITIPLSSFRAEDTKLGKGKGLSVTSLTSLLGTGATSLNIYLHNFSTSATKTGFYGAFDNIRVVKIK